MSGQEKKQYNFPKRDQLIDQIKALDDEIEHVSLNLIKCDFNATEKDVQKAFPEFQFVKVKNYNPGSFEVIFEMKIDAINFIRNCYDRKILARRFFIKLGRQHKEVVEDWACIGYVPKKFNNQKKYPNKKEHKPHEKKQEKEQKTEEAPEQKTKQAKQEKQTKVQKGQPKKEKGQQNKQKKVQNKKQQPPKQETKVEPAQQEDGWVQVPKKSKKK